MPKEEQNSMLSVEKLVDAFAYCRLLNHEDATMSCIFEYVNPAFETLTGLSKDVLLEKQCTEVFPAFSNPQGPWIKALKQVQNKGEPAVFTFHDHNGGLYLECTLYSNHSSHISFMLRPVPGDHQQNIASDQANLYQQFFNTSDYGIVQVNTQGRITHANPAFCAMTGYSMDELQTMEILKDLTPKRWWQWEQEEIRGKRLRQIGSSGLYKKEYIHKDGTVFPVELQSYAMNDEKGAITYFMDIVRDMTEQKNLEQSVRASREMLRVTLNSIGDAVLTTSTHGTVVNLNPMAEKLTGWTEEEASGKALSEVFPIVHAGSRAPVTDPVQEVLQHGKAVDLANDTLLISRDGNEYQIADSAAPIVDATGTILGVVLVFRDVTEEYNRRKALQTSRERLRLALAVANDGLWDWDIATNTTFFDPRYFTMAGYEPDAFPHDFHQWRQRVHQEDLASALAKIQAHLTGKTKKFDLEFRFRRKDNTYMWIRGQGMVVKRDKEGNPLRMVGTHTDITERKQAEQRLKESEEQKRLLLEQMHHGLAVHEVICNEEGHPVNYRFLSTNKRYLELTGLPEDIIGKTVLDVLPNTEPYWIEVFGNVALTGEPCQYENYSQELGKWFRVSVYSPQPHQFAVLIDDVTKQKQMEQMLHLEKEQFKTTLLSVADAILSADPQGNIVVMNKVAEQLTGWTQEEAKGKPLVEIFQTIHEHTRQPCKNPVFLALSTGKAVQLSNHTILISRNGQEIPIEDSASPIMNDVGEISGVVLVFRDCTERKKKQKEIEYLSYHDYLTGLYNRRYFDSKLEQMQEQNHLPLTLLMMDVNGLKMVNEAFGHKTGDIFLQTVAQTLEKICPDTALHARTGSDEFSVLLPCTQEEQGLLLARQIQEALSQKSIEGVPISISCGLGIKLDPQKTKTEVLKEAEDNMYKEKLSDRMSRRNESIQLILRTLHEKIPREKEHSSRVSNLCGQIGEAMDLGMAQINQLITAGILHDIGKIAVSNAILNKIPPLNKQEWEEVKRHAEIGYSILSEVNAYAPLAESVVAHHERWDGTGYPKGLKGEEIPLFARIMAIADAYDAMTRDRPYRKAMAHSAALKEIADCSGSQFDPELAKIFIELQSHTQSQNE